MTTTRMVFEKIGSLGVSIAIPTYQREEVLVNTIGTLIALGEGLEILVLDQTPYHSSEIRKQLRNWQELGLIKWIELESPSIPKAMNKALEIAKGEIVLFLDDDIVPSKGLASAHAANYKALDVVAVVGQVIQPWQSPDDVLRPRRRKGIWEDLDFPFHSVKRAEVMNCMAGNLSVRRGIAILAGGFDERFVGAAYRFETEFCRRLARQFDKKIVFDPTASVRHLKAETGGIRAFGDGAEGCSMEHSVPDYYFAFLEGYGWEFIHYVVIRLWKKLMNRYHIYRPWIMPLSILVEVRSLLAAKRLYKNREKEER